MPAGGRVSCWTVLGFSCYIYLITICMLFAGGLRSGGGVGGKTEEGVWRITNNIINFLKLNASLDLYK